MQGASCALAQCPLRFDVASLMSAPLRHRGVDGATVQAVESENDEILKALLRDVRKVKSSVTDINKEVKEHNSILDNLTSSALAANQSVQRTVLRLQSVTGLSSVWHVWFLIVVTAVVLLYLVALLKANGR